MGILTRDAQIVESLGLPQGFSVVELGNQLYRAGGQKLPSHGWYEQLGAGTYASIDANGMASIQADLNYPIGKRGEMEQFDLVTDFGTGEHILNQAQVYETLHDLCKPGGTIVLHRPNQGWNDHSFFNTHPTLIADLAAANDYEIIVLEVADELRGTLLRAALRKTTDAAFVLPNQGKYKAMLAAANDEPKSVAETPQPRIKRWHVLLDLVKQHNWTRGTEIGVLNGATFFHLLDGAPNLEMYAVDNWRSDDKDYGDLTKVGEEFHANAERYGQRACILQGNSVAMAHEVPNGCLDFCFLDADHSYESVKADIDAWLDKVKRGGMMLGHDWNPERFPGVIKAVQERFGTDTPNLYADHVWGVEL